MATDLIASTIPVGIVAKPATVAIFNSFVEEQAGVLRPTVKGAGIKL